MLIVLPQWSNGHGDFGARKRMPTVFSPESHRCGVYKGKALNASSFLGFAGTEAVEGLS
jgi:hypothetical protein